MAVVHPIYKRAIQNARRDLCYLIYTKQCAPIMLQLAFHDAATYDENTLTGGPNGSIRMPEELEQSCNRGLKVAIDLCEEIKLKHPMISYADIYQLAGVVAVEISGGPIIDFTPGRKDSEECTKEGRLPDDGDDLANLRSKFKRMGLSDTDIVALAGARTLLRTHTDSNLPRFDNSYFKELRRKNSEGLLELPSDQAMLLDFRFSLIGDRFAQEDDAFVYKYAYSHKILSELGFINHPRTFYDFFYLKMKKKEKERNLLIKRIVAAIISASLIFIIVWCCIKAK